MMMIRLVRFVDTRAPGSHELGIKSIADIHTYMYICRFNSYTLTVPGPSFSFCSTSIRSSQSHSSQVDLLLPSALFSYYLTGLRVRTIIILSQLCAGNVTPKIFKLFG